MGARCQIAAQMQASLIGRVGQLHAIALRTLFQSLLHSLLQGLGHAVDALDHHNGARAGMGAGGSVAGALAGTQQQGWNQHEEQAGEGADGQTHDATHIADASTGKLSAGCTRPNRQRNVNARGHGQKGCATPSGHKMTG